jgi:hypothetical protein
MEEAPTACSPSNDNGGKSTKSSRDTSSPDSEPGSKRQKRTVKPLPPGLESISSSNLSKIHCAVEVYTKGSDTIEALLAQYVETEVCDDDGVTKQVRIDLTKDLNLCQLRRFCRQIGVKQTAACNKDACRRAIAMLINFEQGLSNAGLDPKKKEALARNTLLRLVNVVFSPSFLDRFLALNDAKNRWDHETGQLVKNFWKDAAEAHNDNDDPASDLLVLVDNNNDEGFQELLLCEETKVNLDEFECMAPETVQKKIMTLIKIRRLIKENMSISGTHSHRVLDFLDVGINKTKGGRMLNRLGVYYFYIRAEEHGNAIDSAFQPFLDDMLKGSTVPEMMHSGSESSLTGDEDLSDSNTRTSSKLKRAPSRNKEELITDNLNRAIGDIRQDTMKIANEMERANKLEEIKVQIEIARQLGDDGMLRRILQRFESVDHDANATTNQN